MSLPVEKVIVSDVIREYVAKKKHNHIEQHPDGCPDWCADCADRLTCKGGRHEWPRDFSDGDTCFCGGFYLIANSVDERPHIIETPPRREG